MTAFVEASGDTTLTTSSAGSGSYNFAFSSESLKSASVCNVKSSSYPVAPVINLLQSVGAVYVYLPPTAYEAGQKIVLQCVALVSV
jgi:hypothetical protein